MKHVISLDITVKAEDEHEAWKIIDRVLHHDIAEEIIAYHEIMSKTLEEAK